MTPAPLALPPAGETRHTLLTGPAGVIEAQLATPKSAVKGGCVICHPHPLYGGAMSNKVVYTLHSTAAKAGLVTLRFNFRGVGQSEGAHDSARGETDDAVALAEALRAALPPGLPLVLAGFSFGAFVSLKAAPRVRASGLMSVAPPFAATRSIYISDDGGEPPHPGCPWVVIHSRDDDTARYEDSAAVLAHYQPPPTLVSVDGAGHFFHQRLGDVQQAFEQLLIQIV